jgi:tRNA threonylcarbamoyladenosine biosynthesis protein TsaE
LRTRSPQETEALGAQLASELGPGDVVLVSGELGAGKTTLIRAACRALGVRDAVTSPTFTIGRRYEGRHPVSHLDLYRLEGAPEDPGLLDDYLGAATVGFVEWPPDRVIGALADGTRMRLHVRIEHAGGDVREITVERGEDAP